VIGFHYQEINDEVTFGDLSLILGDKCMPKYFGARKLHLLLG
jgi:hypothetical protein